MPPAKPRRNRRPVVNIVNVEDASKLLKGVTALLDKLYEEMNADNFDAPLEVDGGNKIADAVATATAWHFNVRRAFELMKVARTLRPSTPPVTHAAEKAKPKLKR